MTPLDRTRSAPPQPYYDEGGVTIYHGDCREILPALEVDVVVTDPPYGTNHYATDTDVFDGALLAGWVKRFDAVAVFGWPEKLVQVCTDAGAAPTEWVTWWAANGRQRGFNRIGLWRETECIACFGTADWGLLRQPRSITTTPMAQHGERGNVGDVGDARMGDVWRDESPNLNINQPPRLHPNEKPISVMRRLLMVHHGVVVDPFMGSGTTLRAAKDMCRRAIGIELEEKYCEVAAKRMGQEVFDVAA